MRNLPKLDFNITNRCNFRCIHCCFSSGECLLEEMSQKKIREVLSDFRTLGGQRIDITGGEPLIREDTLEIVRFAKNLGLKVELVTNGSLLSEEKLCKLKEIGLDQIAVSLDGSSYEIYRKIRPIDRNLYKQILSNIILSVKMGFPVKINTVAFRSNLSDVPEITQFAIQAGAKEQGLYYFTPIGRGNNSKEEVVDPVLWLKTIRQDLKPFAEKIKLSIESPILETKIADQLEIDCYLKNPWHLQILPDGNVYPCAIMAFKGQACGNLNAQSLREIWQDEKLWNGNYWQNNICCSLESYGSCIDFGQDFKNLIDSDKYRFVCLMCKYKLPQLIERSK